MEDQLLREYDIDVSEITRTYGAIEQREVCFEIGTEKTDRSITLTQLPDKPVNLVAIICSSYSVASHGAVFIKLSGADGDREIHRFTLGKTAKFSEPVNDMLHGLASECSYNHVWYQPFRTPEHEVVASVYRGADPNFGLVTYDADNTYGYAPYNSNCAVAAYVSAFKSNCKYSYTDESSARRYKLLKKDIDEIKSLIKESCQPPVAQFSKMSNLKVQARAVDEKMMFSAKIHVFYTASRLKHEEHT